MTVFTRSAAFAVLLMAGTAPLLMQSANAASNFQTECSARYKAAKAGGTLAGMSWTDFEKNKCVDLKASDAAAATAAAPAVTTKTATTKTTSTKPVTTTAAATDGNFMQTCSASWKQMKDAKTVPAGMKWKDFVKAGCSVQDQASTAEEQVAPIEPADTSAAADPTVKTVDKNGKPFTAGQSALHQRMKECGLEWRTAKAASKIKAGQTWPQYWSACNTRLKTASN